jgi:hypothetical protein
LIRAPRSLQLEEVDTASTIANENGLCDGAEQPVSGDHSADGGEVAGSSITTCGENAPLHCCRAAAQLAHNLLRHERCRVSGRLGTVHASEEVLCASALALLWYLRDPPVSRATAQAINEQEVRFAAVNFAEWARRGDAHPIQYAHFDAELVRRMTSAGALFGRKFAPGCVSVEHWRKVLEQVRSGGEPAATGRSEAYPAGARDAANNGYQQQPRHNNDGSRRRDQPERTSYADYGGSRGYSNCDRDRYGDEDRQGSYYEGAYHGNRYSRDCEYNGGDYGAHTEQSRQGNHYHGRDGARQDSHGRSEEYRGSGAGYDQPYKRHRY